MVDAELHEPDERAATIDPSARDGLIQSTVQRNPKARAKNTSFLPRSCSRRNGKRTEPFLQRTESAGSHAPGGRPWPTAAHPRRQAAAPLSPANHAGLDWSSAALHTVLPQITESLGISISEGWSQIRGPGAPIMAGFREPRNHASISAAQGQRTNWRCFWAWPSSGAAPARPMRALDGLASSRRPSLFGQGFGQLPDTIGWARPLAVTGQIGYQIPTMSYDVGQGAFIPQVLVYGASVQYSMPYLKAEVKDLHLADFINHDSDCRAGACDAGRQQFWQPAIPEGLHEAGSRPNCIGSVGHCYCYPCISMPLRRTAIAMPSVMPVGKTPSSGNSAPP